MENYQSGFRADLFAGQRIFIPGGGGGLGRCIAHELASLGAELVLAGRSEEKLKRTAREITEDGGRVLEYYSVELRDEPAVIELVDKVVKQHGPMQGLVNAAGGQFPSKLSDLSLNGWNAVLHNNLTSYFLVAREIYRRCMREHGGAIVNISTYATFEPEALFPTSGVFRSALAGFTKLFADKYAADNIRMNNVLPGFIDSLPESDERRERIPMGRYGSVAEVGELVVFLASERSSYMTGQNLRIDGGITRSV